MLFLKQTLRFNVNTIIRSRSSCGLFIFLIWRIKFSQVDVIPRSEEILQKKSKVTKHFYLGLSILMYENNLYICIYQNKLNDYMIFILQVSNMFIMSLALADLTVGVIVMPITSAYTITGNF